MTPDVRADVAAIHNILHQMIVVDVMMMVLWSGVLGVAIYSILKR